MAEQLQSAASSALDGRMPVLPSERVFLTSGSFSRTCIAFGSAIWVFLIGSSLPAVGDTRLSVIGYAIGLIVGFGPVVLATGVPCFKYGVDTVDACKSAFGVRGALVALIGTLIAALGSASVVMSMVAQGVAKLIGPRLDPGNTAHEGHLAILIAFVVIAICWQVVRSGPIALQRVNNVVGPSLIILATVSLILLVRRFGWTHLWTTNVSADKALTPDRLKSLAYAIEFGMVTSMSWWPFLGGLFRLVKKRSHVFTPSMVGLTLTGGAYCSGIAALAAASMATSDPLEWIVKLAGPVVGTVLVMLILVANVPIMALLVYFAGVSVQQFRPLARIRWGLLLSLLLVPSMAAAFNTQWVITHVLTVQVYVGMQFIVITGIGCVDYYVLRRQNIDIAQLFVKTKAGRYWFWGGVNWVALLVIAFGSVMYFSLYDPLTLQAPTVFRYLGASVPVIVLSSSLYYVLMRFLVVPCGIGGYAVRWGATSSMATKVSL